MSVKGSERGYLRHMYAYLKGLQGTTKYLRKLACLVTENSVRDLQIPSSMATHYLIKAY